MGSHDLIVVGGGPAGTMTAYQLARRGWRVLLLERSPMPRPKACGGALSPKAYRQLDLDISDLVRARVGRCYLRARGLRPFLLQSASAELWMVLREEFDARLWQAAAEAGAQLHDGEAVRAISEEGLVRTDRGRYQGRVVVGADGSEGLVPRAVGLRHPPQRYMVAVHVEAPFPAWDRTETALLDFSIPRGYAWVFPKGDLYNVGACTTGKAVGLKKSLEAFLRQEGLEGQSASPYHARRIPLGGKARPLHRGKVLLVGDAAGLADPLLGEGIAYALMSAQMAATAIAEYLEGRSKGLAGYSQRVQDTLHRDLRALALLAAFVYRFPRLALRLLGASPRLQRRALGIISGEGSPSKAWP